MICPQDRTPLIPHKRDGVEARSCLQCHGVWFSRAALESLAKKTPQPKTAEPPLPSNATGFVLRRLACPACAGSQLQTRMQGDIEISRCRDCGGIWLAKTEVTKILAARSARPASPVPRAGSDATAPPPDAGVATDIAAGAVEAGSLLVVGEGVGVDMIFVEFLASIF